jgi:diaminopimelate decarboxylase
MNDLIRPSLYDAFHDIWPICEATGKSRIEADVVGPICETSDFLSRNRSVPDAVPGELLAVMSAGAYGYTMASNYCSRRRVPEVMVKDKAFYVIRRRQTHEDLIAGESVPEFLDAR